MHQRVDPPQLLDHEPPASRRLERNLKLLATEPLQEPAHASTVGRADPTALNLTGLAVKPLSGDLRSMLIKSHYDAHKGPPHARRLPSLRGHAPRLS
jgi:hypothetical protein